MSPWRIWRHPLWIGALTAVGLVAGLVSDGWGDALAAVGLGVPAATALFFGLRRSRGEGASLQPLPTQEK
jgi:hypothetical protein